MTKLCINCKHFDNKGALRYEWCRHPHVGYSLIDGKIKPSQASTQRLDLHTIETCGTEGKWFETKYPVNPDKNNWTYMTVQRPSPEPVKLTLWQKLKGLFK